MRDCKGVYVWVLAHAFTSLGVGLDGCAHGCVGVSVCSPAALSGSRERGKKAHRGQAGIFRTVNRMLSNQAVDDNNLSAKKKKVNQLKLS